MSVLNKGVLEGLRKIVPAFRGIDIDSGIPGSPYGWRLRGATAGGPPSKGTWRTGDVVPSQSGAFFICTAGGNPGTWSSVSGIGTYNIGAYGGLGTAASISADTVLIQSLLNTVPAGSTIVFDKFYRVNAVLTYPISGNLTLQGIDQQTGLGLANGTTLDALLAPAGWDTNTWVSGNGATFPMTIRDMYFQGQPSQASGLGHLLVVNFFWSYIEDCNFSNALGSGIYFTGCSVNNAQVLTSGQAVQNRVHRCQFYSCAFGAIQGNDPGGAFTDGFITDCIFQAVGSSSTNASINLPNMAGWEIRGNHFFGNGGHVIAGKPFMTKIESNYFEQWGSNTGASGFYPAVDWTTAFDDGGLGSAVTGNVAFMGSLGASSSQCYFIYVSVFTGGHGTVSVTGNVIVGPGAGATGNLFAAYGLGGQDQTAIVTASVSGNTVMTPGLTQPFFIANGNASATTNVTLYGDCGQQETRLGTAFTSGTGTAVQNVTGMSTSLLPGNYEIDGWFPMSPAGTTGSTQLVAFTFSGTTTQATVTWNYQGGTFAAPVIGSSITTGFTTPTMTAAGVVIHFKGHVVVSAAGTLQLTVKSTTSGDECTIPVGAYMTVKPCSY